MLKLSEIQDFVWERFRTVKAKPSMNRLIAFHTFNKYLFMAFSQVDLNAMGKLVANHEKLPITSVLDNYEKSLAVILSKRPTRSRHANVLQRMYGHFYDKLPPGRHEIIEHAISEYQKNNAILGDVLHKLKLLTGEIDNIYLAKQSYFLLFSDKIGLESFH